MFFFPSGIHASTTKRGMSKASYACVFFPPRALDWRFASGRLLSRVLVDTTYLITQLEREREVVLGQIEQMKLKERRDLEEKRQTAREMQESLARANMEQTQVKQRMADAEKQEELRIAACILLAPAPANSFN